MSKNAELFDNWLRTAFVQMSDIPSTLDSGLAKVIIKPFNYTDKETGKSKGMCRQSQFP